MKVLFVTNSDSLLGANRSMLDLIYQLRSIDIESHVVVSQTGELSSYLMTNEMSVTVCDFPSWVYTKVNKNYWLYSFRSKQREKALQNLLGIIKSIKFDIIHSNSSTTMAGAFLAERLNKPHVWHIREMVELHYKTKYLDGKESFEKWMNKSSYIIPISKVVNREVLSNIKASQSILFDGIFSEKDIGEINHLIQERKPEKDFFQFLSIGLLHPQKAQLEVVKTFTTLKKKLPNINLRLVIVGGGRRVYQKRIELFIRRSGMQDYISLEGYQPNPGNYYLESDALIMSSRHEAMGRTTVEGLAYGLMVIGKNSGATPEIIKQGENGYLYDNENGLLSLMEKSIFLGSEQKEKIKSEAYKTVKEKFMVENYVAKIMEIYKKVLS